MRGGTEIAARALARDIARCAELEAVLDGRASGCRRWSAGRACADRPGGCPGALGWSCWRCRDLVVSSNPSAGPREEPFDPARHMSRQDSDENLLAAADGAFDDLRFPGIADGRHNRDRNGRRTGPAVPFWRWTQGIARELLGRGPGRRLRPHRGGALRSPGRDRRARGAGDLHEPELRRLLSVSPAAVVVVVGKTTRRLRGPAPGAVRRHRPAAVR